MDSNRGQKTNKIYSASPISEKIRNFNWGDCTLGAIDAWPQVLVFHVNRILESGFPMVIWWGKDHLQISNDACDKLSRKIPAFSGLNRIGVSPEEASPQLWPLIKSKIEQIHRFARSSYAENEPLFAKESSPLGGVYWTNSFDPLRDEEGDILGVVAIFKETNHIYRSLEQTRRQQSFMLELNDRLARVDEPVEKEIVALSAVGAFLDLDRLGLAEPVAESENFLVKRYYLKESILPIIGQYIFSPSEGDQYDRLRKGECISYVQRLSADYNDGDQNAVLDFNKGALLCVPVNQAGKLVAVFLANMSEPHDWKRAEVSLLRQAAVRIWDSLLVARAKAQLSESERRYRTLFESLDEGFMVIDFIFDDKGSPCDYRFLQLNPAFERQSGLKCELGKTILEIMPDIEKRWIERYGQVATSRCPARFQDYNQSTDKWYEVYAAPMDNSRSQVVVVFKDITERKKEEQRKEDFLSVASHELKTPITALNGYLYMFRHLIETRDHNSALKLVDKAGGQTARMLGLIDSFLNTSQLNAGLLMLEQTVFDLAVTLRETVNDLVDQNHIYHFEYEVPSSLIIRGDELKITHVVNNLLDNAMKFSPRGSLIRLNCCLQEGEAMVTVEDHGIGLATEEFEKIFERFYRVETKKSSTISGFGIGLYVCKEIVELHKGRIGVFSESGEGSTFWFTLPS